MRLVIHEGKKRGYELHSERFAGCGGFISLTGTQLQHWTQVRTAALEHRPPARSVLRRSHGHRLRRAESGSMSYRC